MSCSDVYRQTPEAFDIPLTRQSELETQKQFGFQVSIAPSLTQVHAEVEFFSFIVDHVHLVTPVIEGQTLVMMGRVILATSRCSLVSRSHQEQQRDGDDRGGRDGHDARDDHRRHGDAARLGVRLATRRRQRLRAQSHNIRRGQSL